MIWSKSCSFLFFRLYFQVVFQVVFSGGISGVIFRWYFRWYFQVVIKDFRSIISYEKKNALKVQQSSYNSFLHGIIEWIADDDDDKRWILHQNIIREKSCRHAHVRNPCQVTDMDFRNSNFFKHLLVIDIDAKS